MVDHKNSQDLANMPIESASQASLSAILTLLTESGLPQEGVSEHLSTALLARAGRQVVGCAALEFYGSAALLRSVAVDRSYRGQGLGQRLTEAALRLAQENGVTRVYLLTETAGQFFFQIWLPADRPLSRTARSARFYRVHFPLSGQCLGYGTRSGKCRTRQLGRFLDLGNNHARSTGPRQGLDYVSCSFRLYQGNHIATPTGPG